MAFDWREYPVVARELAKDGRESTSRISISRAYYCSYNLGRRYALSQGYAEPSRSTHAALWKWFQSQPHPLLRSLGVKGERLKSKRVDADYIDAPIKRLSDVVQDSLRDAQEFEHQLP